MTAPYPTTKPAPFGRGALLLSLLVSTLVLTWPLAQHLGHALPLGAERSGTVPYFNLWTFAWNADRLAHGLEDYWNAPIFHPTPGTFALSDPQPLTGAAFALLRLLVGSDVTTYNLLFLIAVFANGVASAWFARSLGCNTIACLLAGVLAQSLPALAAEAGVFQLVGIAPSIVTVGLFVRLARRPSGGTGLALGCALAVTFLTSEYYGVYTGLLLLPGVLLLLQRRPGPRHAAAIGAALAPLLLLVLPVVIGQSANSIETHRATGSLARTSARTFDYTGLPPVTLGSHVVPWLTQRRDLRVGLYPGTALLALAGAGVILSWRFRRRRRLVLYFGAATLAAFLLSLGPTLGNGFPGPYRILYELVPGFDKMRNTYRFGIFVQIFLLLLATLGIREIFRRRAPALAIALTLIGLAEVLPLPRPLVRAPSAATQASWTAQLARLPHGVAVALPFPDSKRSSDYVRTVADMLDGLDHRKPLLNGYSGFLPEVHRDDYPTFASFPEGEWLAWCKQRGVRYVILDDRWLREEHPSFVVPPNLTRVAGDATRSVYELATFLKPAPQVRAPQIRTDLRMSGPPIPHR